MIMVKKPSMNKSLAKTPYSSNFSPNTTFFTPLTPGRLAFGLVLGQVDRNIEMVDQYKEGGRPSSLPQSLKLSYNFFYDSRMAYRKKRNDDNKKLTRVLSTKLSIEDYNLFRVMTNICVSVQSNQPG
jgi:hypothetical protein